MQTIAAANSTSPSGKLMDPKEATRLARQAAARAWDGTGSDGTEPARGQTAFRILAVAAQVASFIYLCELGEGQLI